MKCFSVFWMRHILDFRDFYEQNQTFQLKTVSIWSQCNDQPVCLPMTLHELHSTTVVAHIRFYFFITSFLWQLLRLGPVVCGLVCHFGDRNKCGDNEKSEPGENAKTKSATSLGFQLSSALLGALNPTCQKGRDLIFCHLLQICIHPSIHTSFRTYMHSPTHILSTHALIKYKKNQSCILMLFAWLTCNFIKTLSITHIEWTE